MSEEIKLPPMPDWICGLPIGTRREAVWNAPQVVRDYLTTGDESLRAAAWDTSDAAPVAARDAARDAAKAAQRERFARLVADEFTNKENNDH